MKRTEFLRRSFRTLGAITVIPVFGSCKPNEEIDSEAGSDSGACVLTESETDGPFPTKNPASLVLEDITSDRNGTSLNIRITIQNKNNNCEPLANAIVDIWHCDASGNYSQYGNTGMQRTDYTNVSFLRGRQATNGEGVAGFKSIYPGWYSGRAPHIHVHVYNSAGKSLLITQIAFPEAISAVVYAQGVYASKGQADTSIARDNVFGDGVSTEMATVTGSASQGYELTHAIVVKG